MRKLAEIVAGRRSKWFVILAWVVLLFVLAPLGAKLGDETIDDTQSFLPAAPSPPRSSSCSTRSSNPARRRPGSWSTSDRAA